MRFVDTIKNIWKIEDLRKRITITIALVLVYSVVMWFFLVSAQLNSMPSEASQAAA